MTISIHKTADPNKLLAMEGTWNALVNECSGNPFLLSGFVRQFLEFYRLKGWSPLLLVISTDKNTVGVAPLMAKSKFGVLFVKFLSKSWLSPDFIFDDQYREACIAHTLDFLFKTLGCQFVDLVLPAESQNMRVLKKRCKANGIHFCTGHGRWADMGHCVIPARHTWDEFIKLRGSNFRRRFKRLKRNLDRAGTLNITCIENMNKGSDAFEKILNVERMSWKEAWRVRSGIRIDSDLLMIWKGSQYSARVEPDFNSQVWFLELNHEVLAYTLILQYKEVAYITKTSYDERYKRFQPGIYVNNAAICELFTKGKVRKIDFLTDLPFHRNWTSKRQPRVRVLMSQKGVLRNIMSHVLVNECTRSIMHCIPDPLLARAEAVHELCIPT